MSGARMADGDDAQNALAGVGAFQRDALVVLDGLGAVRGQTVMNGLRKNGYVEMSSGRLYSNLDGLAESGLVQKKTEGIDGRSNAYEITEEGREKVREYLEWGAEQSEVER